MKLTNFYVDEKLQQEINDKLRRLKGEENKGQFSALIRVLLKQFAATPDEKVSKLLIDAVDAEYTVSAKRNKRSRL